VARPSGPLIARQSSGVSNMLKIGFRWPSSGIPTLHVTWEKVKFRTSHSRLFPWEVATVRRYFPGPEIRQADHVRGQTFHCTINVSEVVCVVEPEVALKVRA
jgi:hypothetical protein